MLELIASIERIGGRKVPHNLAPRRAGDPPALVADPNRAARLLGWRATHARTSTRLVKLHLLKASTLPPGTRDTRREPCAHD